MRLALDLYVFEDGRSPSVTHSDFYDESKRAKICIQNYDLIHTSFLNPLSELSDRPCVLLHENFVLAIIVY